MSWLKEWQEPEGVRLFLGSFNLLTQNYAIETAEPKSRILEKTAVQQFLKEQYPGDFVKKDENGKPFFTGKKIHFNYSHSQTDFFWGEHNQYPIGVDVECERPQILRVAHKFCNEAEWNYTQQGTNISQLLAIWSAKESMYKAYGKGIVDFKLDMNIEPFVIEDSGVLVADFYAGQNRRLTIYYRRFNRSICTWTLWR